VKTPSEYAHLNPFFAYICFLLTGTGISMCYTSLSSSISYFSFGLGYGSNFYRFFLAAYYALSLPILFFQLTVDKFLDKRFGTRNTFYIRLTLTACVEVLITASIPYLPENKYLLLGLMVVVGLFDALGYGSISQFGSNFPYQCLILIFVGQSVTSILLLIATIVFDYGAYPSSDSVKLFFAYAAAIIIMGFVLFNILMCTSYAKFFLKTKDKLLSSNTKYYSIQDSKTQKDETSFLHILKLIKLLLIAIFIHWFSYTLVQSFYGMIPTSQPKTADAQRLAQILVYTNLFGDFLGKQIAFIKIPYLRTILGLLIAVCVRALYTIFFIIYVAEMGVFKWKSNIFIIVLNSIFCIFGGYLTASIYTVTSETVTKEATGTAASLINIFLYFGILTAIGFSFALEAVVVMPMGMN